MQNPIIITEDGEPTTPSAEPSAKPDVKDRWITFRVTAAEHFLLMDKATRSGMGAGEYARSRALRGIARKKKTPVTTDAFGADTRALLHELRQQGGNLNQLAHHCNRHQVPPPPELATVIASLQALWRDVMGRRAS